MTYLQEAQNPVNFGGLTGEDISGSGHRVSIRAMFVGVVG